MNNKKIFISGSLSNHKLPSEVIQSIFNSIEKQYTFIVGDANGVDKAVQVELKKNAVKNVDVYHVGSTPRNLLDNDWQNKELSVDISNSKLFKNNRYTREAQFYKDNAMADAADLGLVIWQDTKINRFGNIEVSKGSLRNIVNLLFQNKYVGLYLTTKPELGTMKFKRLESFENDVINNHVHEKTKEYYFNYKKKLLKDNDEIKKNNSSSDQEQLSLFNDL